MHICLWRAFKRSLYRLLTRKSCCNGNVETFGRLIGRDSILKWVWRTYSRRKAAYEELFAFSEYSNRFVRLTSDRAVREFFEALVKRRE